MQSDLEEHSAVRLHNSTQEELEAKLHQEIDLGHTRSPAGILGPPTSFVIRWSAASTRPSKLLRTCKAQAKWTREVRWDAPEIWR